MASWIVDVVKRDPARTRLLAFPPSGAGVAFLAGFGPTLAAAMDFAVVRLPGREALISAPPISNLEEIVAGLVRELADRADDDLILCGCCTGGLMAYELAQQLTRQSRSPRAFIAIGAPPPHVMLHERPLHRFSSEDLKAYYAMGETDGDYPDEVWRKAEPRIRADLEAVEAATYSPTPLEVPIVALRGVDDDIIPRARTEQWEACTSSLFILKELPGDHFLVNMGVERVAQELVQLVSVDGPLAAIAGVS